MILQTYSAFRAAFALAGASLAPDGFEVWPVAKLRAAGFTGLVTPTISALPLTITVNASAVDGGFAYDWYLSQRSDDPATQYMRITNPDPLKSGTVLLEVNPSAVALLLPDADPIDYTQAANLALIFKRVSLYVQRRSDKAIQWIKLYAG